MVKIITDSTCDLTKERMEELGVICVPLTVHIGDDIYLDGVNLSKTEFYEKEFGIIFVHVSYAGDGILLYFFLREEEFSGSWWGEREGTGKSLFY